MSRGADTSSTARPANRAAVNAETKAPAAPLLVAMSTLAVALLYALFAFVVYGVIGTTTVMALFQGIASAMVGGRVAYSGGARTFALGVALHVLVALAWSLIFLLALRGTKFVPRMLATRFGALKVAAWYGPLSYVVMTMAVIPVFTHRVPPLSTNWLAMLLGHIPFVGLPIALIVGRAARSWNP
jgi:hypothetical protein